MEFFKLFIPAALSCSCNALANMFWKLRLDKSPLIFDSFKNIVSTLFSVNIFAGVCFYGISMMIFFYMLSNYKLSSIIPVTCLTYIFNFIIAKLVFHEEISGIQIIGTIIIIVGLIVLSKAPVIKI